MAEAAEEAESYEDYTVPLKEPSYFGAGITKRGIKFLPASNTDAELTPASSTTSSADRYLSIVLGKTSSEANLLLEPPTANPEAICDICKLPVDPSNAATHESSLAHQVSLEHIHPPSAVDRTRKGVFYLQNAGWDPDSRRGLGATGEGILHPIKPKENMTKEGLGSRSRLTKPGKPTPVNTKPGKPTPVKAPKLNAKQRLKLEQEEKKRKKRLHDMFYTDDRVERYLGPGA